MLLFPGLNYYLGMTGSVSFDKMRKEKYIGKQSQTYPITSPLGLAQTHASRSNKYNLPSPAPPQSRSNKCGTLSPCQYLPHLA
jgi:hypothetical protein